MKAETSSIGHIPTGNRWQFDQGVVDVFDDMLARSIPDYPTMRDLVFTLGATFIQPQTTIVDLGAARGAALAPFIDRFGALNNYVGIEISEPMLAALRERFKGFINTRIVEISNLDLRREYPMRKASLTLAVLTFQFIPVEYRQSVARRVFESTLAKGAFILVEKIIGADSAMQELFTTRYLDMKAAHGYSREEIDRKRFSLEGVLVPLSASMNENLLVSAGFTRVECFWRWCNFAAWLAVRDA